MARIRPRAGGLLVPAVTELGRELGQETVLGAWSIPDLRRARGDPDAVQAEREHSRPSHRDVIEPGSYDYMIGNLETAATPP